MALNDLLREREPKSEARQQNPSPILVTGAAGFIGSHFAERARVEGYPVVGVDNFSPLYDRSLKEENLDRLRTDSGFDLVEGDIRDADLIRDLVSRVRPRSIVHLAALAGVRPSLTAAPAYVSVNVGGTTNLLDAAVEQGVEEFIFISSSSVYGNNKKVPFSESDPVGFPISPYAATKRAGELICHAYHHLHSLPTTCLRLFTVYGPRQRPDLAISRFLNATADGLPITLFGDGSKSRDFTYVDDIVTGVMGAIAHLRRKGGFGIYNLGGNEPVTLTELLSAIAAVTGIAVEVQKQHDQQGDAERTWADLTKSRNDLGFQPMTKLVTGLDIQWQWTLRSRAKAR